MATPKDKELHFWAGVAISFAAVIFFKAIEIEYCTLWVAASVIVAAIGKEVKDFIDYRGFDWRDAVYTIAGGAPGFILSFF